MDVVAALADCRTTADHYRVQIDAENFLSPAEIAGLAAMGDALPPQAHTWVQRLLNLGGRIRRDLQPYTRRALGENAMLYEGIASEDASRILVVGFSGVANRMMLPVAPFLQALPAARCDVLVLRDPARTAFLRGVPGYAPDLPALAARLGADLPLSRYAERRCIGTSSGGAAALAFGTLIGASVALSLGGTHPRGMATAGVPPGPERFAFDRLFDGHPPARTRLICCHGQDCIRDSVRGRLMAMATPGAEVLVVPRVALHAVLPGLVPHNAMARFIEEVLLDARLPDDGAWQP
jgi:hypothetical protein